MKVAFFVGEFPSLSTTFILNQVTGLLDRGHEVVIFADRPSGEGGVHPDVAKYDMAERIRYVVPMPASMRRCSMGSGPTCNASKNLTEAFGTGCALGLSPTGAPPQRFASV